MPPQHFFFFAKKKKKTSETFGVTTFLNIVTIFLKKISAALRAGKLEGCGKLSLMVLIFYNWYIAMRRYARLSDNIFLESKGKFSAHILCSI